MQNVDITLQCEWVLLAVAHCSVSTVHHSISIMANSKQTDPLSVLSRSSQGGRRVWKVTDWLEQSICKYDAVTTTSAGLELDIRQLYFYIIWAWPLLICHSDEIQVKWVCKISKTISFHKWHLVIRAWSLIITMMSSGEEDIIVSDTSFISFNQDTT